MIGLTKNQNLGIHVSAINGKITFSTLKQYNIKFVIAKTTMGLHIDQMWSQNKKAIKENSLLLGSNHIFYDHIDPIEQANHFSHFIIESDLPPIIEFTKINTNIQNGSKNFFKFINTLENIINKSAIISSNESFLSLFPTKYYKELMKKHLWLIQYDHATPSIPRPWSDVQSLLGWKFSTSKGLLPANYDVDLCLINIEDLKSFCIKPTNPVLKFNIDNIHSAQLALSMLGYLLPLNGVMDLQTKNAILDFQTKHALKKSGLFDEETKTILKTMV